MVDVLVIGAGPAGITAAIYAKRAGNDVAVIYSGKTNLEEAVKIDNYYGFEDGIDGKSLYEAGLNQAKNLGIQLIEDEVLNVRKEQSFIVEAKGGEHKAKSIVIATGNKKIRPGIAGIKELEGKGISYCAICDGFFYRNKRVAVIGSEEFAVREAAELEKIVQTVTILTNGEPLNVDTTYETITKKIAKIVGSDKVSGIEFEDGTTIDLDGIFIAIGEAGGVDFAKRMGIILNGDSIVVDEDMKTNVDGVFACGNVTGGLLQICKSTYEGAKAGLAASKFIRE